MPEKNKAKKAEAVEKFVTVEQFEKFGDAVIERLEALANKPAPQPLTAAQVKEEEAVKSAGPDNVQTNPAWDAVAREQLGEYLDHTEVQYGKSGTIAFTIVIKNEKSNAPADYMERVHCDRRTREVSSEGLEGVTMWVRLVKAQLLKNQDLKK